MGFSDQYKWKNNTSVLEMQNTTWFWKKKKNETRNTSSIQKHQYTLRQLLVQLKLNTVQNYTKKTN